MKNKLKPFTTDGCSDCGISNLFGIFNEKIPAVLNPICVEHDKCYWLGDACGKTRAQVDREFRDAIRKAGYPKIANLYWVSVRFGGTGLFPTPFRWGYGWSYLSEHKEK